MMCASLTLSDMKSGASPPPSFDPIVGRSFRLDTTDADIRRPSSLVDLHFLNVSDVHFVPFSLNPLLDAYLGF
jgi:hypothetical protein